MKQSLGISILRVAATLFVVLFHSLGYYTQAWPFDGIKINAYSSFDIVLNQITMPTFFFLSAYIFGYKVRKGQYSDKLSFFKNKTLRLLVPYLFWSIIQHLLFSNQIEPAFSLNGNLLYSLLHGYLHLWFLLVLFFYFCFFYLLSNIWRKFGKTTSTIILLALTIIASCAKPDTSLLCLNGFVHYIPFFYCGILVSGSDLKQTKIIPYLLLCLCGIVTLTLFTLYIHIGPKANMFVREVASLTTVFSLFLIATSAKKIPSGNPEKILFSIDRNSFGIYILHHIIIWWSVQRSFLQPFLNEHYIIAPLLVFAASFCLSWLLSEIIRKNKFTGLLMGEHIK